MRYNLNKIMVFWINSEVVGCVRVARPEQDNNKIRPGYLVLFLNPKYSTNDEVLKTVFTEIEHIKIYLKRYSHIKWHIMSQYLPPMKYSEFGFAVEASQQFGGTARKRSSSVLIDEATGEPLF